MMAAPLPIAGRETRRKAIVSLFFEGRTHLQIAADLGVSRSTVTDVLWAEGVSGKQGGAQVQHARKHGCTLAQIAVLQAVRREMIGSGESERRTPFGAFGMQKHHAKARGIEWRLTLWEWWEVWSQSGKWAYRGRGQAYVMCRHGDEGAYEPGNVFIGLCAANSSDGKRSDLPIGVKKVSGGFEATRMLGGKTFYLGRYSSPHLAHAAYLSIAPFAPDAAGLGCAAVPG